MLQWGTLMMGMGVRVSAGASVGVGGTDCHLFKQLERLNVH